MFCIFCPANILQKVLEHFWHSSFVLILAQIFAPFDSLHSSWCNLSWKFSVIVSFFILYFQSFSGSTHSQRKGWSMSFFRAWFSVFNESLVEEWLFFTFLTLFRMDFPPTPPLLKICQTYPTMIKLGTVIPYP